MREKIRHRLLSDAQPDVKRTFRTLLLIRQNLTLSGLGDGIIAGRIEEGQVRLDLMYLTM